MADVEFEPLLGDPSLVERKGEEYKNVADAIRRSLVNLDRITEEIRTKSLAMDETRKLAGDVRDDIVRALDRYSETGEALTSYAHGLSTAQAQANAAILHLRHAQNDLEDAAWAVWVARNDAESLTVDASAAQRQSADRAVARAQRRDAEALGEVARREQEWREARDAKDAAARAARDRILDVVEGSRTHGLRDSGWDIVGDFAAGVYKVFKAICEIAAILAPILSWVPVIGTAIFALGLIGTLIGLAEAIVTLVRERTEGALGGVALAALGLFGAKAVTALGKFASARLVVATEAQILATGAKAAPRVASARLGAGAIRDAKSFLEPAQLRKTAAEVFDPRTSLRKTPEWAKALKEGKGLREAFGKGFPDSPHAWLGVDDDIAQAWKSVGMTLRDGPNPLFAASLADDPLAAAALRVGTALNGAQIAVRFDGVRSDVTAAVDAFSDGNIVDGVLSVADSANGVADNGVVADALGVAHGINDVANAVDDHDLLQGGEMRDVIGPGGRP
ncbi:hypothetical protein [Xylanimonas ulmi]|uniref:Uncharacterized protein n=1 Tax=Xylanimonas ulmi TaxID=228973 RepID=A0A4Q7MA53_9MICO|nr:hypothetical protein [Xylanibacterium ulmi]RZS63109.1 hypothetical protein EV386_3467 [Xylanibacterium ulmi]